MTQVPPPPGNLRTDPDQWTKKSPDLPKQNGNSNNIAINFLIIKFNTDDKLQGAAILFGLLLFFAWIILLAVDLFIAIPAAKDQLLGNSLTVLWSGFLVALGVAIGRGKDAQDN